MQKAGFLIKRVMKFLNFPTPINFAVNSKIETKMFYHSVIPPNDANGIVNSVGSDHSAPLRAI